LVPTPFVSSGRQSAKTVAVRLLSRREHSACELQQKLLQRGFEGVEIKQALDALEQGGWLSDQRFAETYVRMRQQKGFGPVRIAMELRERGVEDATIEQAVASSEVDWQTSLSEQYEKKFRNKTITDYADKAKRIRFLQYRGFSLQDIYRCIGDDEE